MAVIKASSALILKEINHRPSLVCSVPTLPRVVRTLLPTRRGISIITFRCAASKKISSRQSRVQQLLEEAEERALSADTGPIPQITLDHVTMSFARSGGAGGQNVNKVNTKVDMRFNVKNAYWLSDRIREKVMQMVRHWSFLYTFTENQEHCLDGIIAIVLSIYDKNHGSNELEKNRINKDGELVISSTKTRTQKGNIDDALEKLQAIIDAAAYVPPPPSEEQKKKIAKIAAIGEQKRLKSKKVLSDKKAFRRSRDSWD